MIEVSPYGFNESLVKVGVCEDRNTAIDYLMGNIAEFVNNNFPFQGAPERQYMPQTDAKAIKVAKEGQTNI